MPNQVGIQCPSKISPILPAEDEFTQEFLSDDDILALIQTNDDEDLEQKSAEQNGFRLNHNLSAQEKIIALGKPIVIIEDTVDSMQSPI